MKKLRRLIMLIFGCMFVIAISFSIYSSIFPSKHIHGGSRKQTPEEHRIAAVLRTARDEERRGQYIASIADYKSVIAEMKFDQNAHFELAKVYEEAGEKQPAYRELKDSIMPGGRYHPNEETDPAILEDFGELALQLRHPDDANWAFNEITIQSSYKAPGGLISDGSSTEGASKRSIARYEASLRPELTSTRSNQLVKEAISLSPSWGMARVILALNKVVLHQNEDAHRQLIRAIRCSSGQTLSCAARAFERESLDSEAKITTVPLSGGGASQVCFRRGRKMGYEELAIDAVSEYKQISLKEAQSMLAG